MSQTSSESLVKRFHDITQVPEASENMRIFLREAPDDVAERFLDMLEAINATPDLDYKIKALIRTVVSMVLGHERGVTAWSQAAISAGASRLEVVEALYTVIPQVGAIPIIRMLPLVLGEPPDKGSGPGTEQP
jgi:alkylhydroperoxidase/carboxymuconolactone decarboxylase family protein YurZ